MRNDLPLPTREALVSKQQWQKFEEMEQLSVFLNAYESRLGESLLNIDRDAKGERPDFICQSSDGTRVGIELTEIPHSELQMWDKVFNPDMSWWELLDEAKTAVFKKEAKRSTGAWRHADKQLLVMMLTSHGFEYLGWLSDPENQHGFQQTGFSEIWICDNTTQDAHGASQLIGLFPQDVWGVQNPQDLNSKPFG